MSEEDKNKVEVQEETNEKEQQQEEDSDEDNAIGQDGLKKANRGEKKFKKAMTKLGLKPVSGINRVTIKRGKQLLLYIDEPEVMKSPSSENSYIVFGEAKINDFASQMAQSEAKHLHKHDKAEKKTEQKTETVIEKKDEVQDELSEEGLDPEAIKMVMEHSKVSKPQAIKALREADGDRVNAILKLSEQ